MKLERFVVIFPLLMFFLLALHSSVFARTWCINPEGTGDAPTIQAGIDSAVVADTVSLADGTYRGIGNRDIDFGGKAITVRSQGGNPDLCIIDCEGLLPSTGFYFRSGETQTSILEGVQVTNGFAYAGVPNHPLGTAVMCSGTASPTIQNCSFKSNAMQILVETGGVLSCSDSASPCITDCTFRDNTITGSMVEGSVFYCTDNCAPMISGCQFVYNTGTSLTCSEFATVTSCMFSNNTGRGLNCNGSVTVSGCTFFSNNGGGMYSDGSIIITDCHFEENSAIDGGGIYLTESGQNAFVTIEDCTFLRNSATRGGGVYVTRLILGIVPSFINCSFVADSAETGGGVYCNQYSSPMFSHCTFSGNSASTDGGGVYCGIQTSPTVTNCTFAENSALGNGAGIYFRVPPVLLEKTIAAFSLAGEGVYLRHSVNFPEDLRCCDIFGNAGGDWVGHLEELDSISGNFSADPLFCDLGAHNYLLAMDSPCAPGNHPYGEDCGYIGADTIGCQSVDVTITGFEIEYGNSSVTLKWTICSSEGIKGFRIYKSIGMGGVFTQINPFPFLGTDNDKYIDKDISPGGKYRYRLCVLTDDSEFISQILFIEIPEMSFVLHQNFPNPFNPKTTIKYILVEASEVTLTIYDIAGRDVRTLVNRWMKPGIYKEEWDGKNTEGQEVASGIYFYQLKTGKNTFSRKMVFLK